MTDYAVYKHTSPSGKCYIGITSKKPEHRWNHGKAYCQNKYFTRAIKKYGWENFSHEIIFHGLSKEEACKTEKQLIQLCKSNNPKYGYNLSTGGENPAEGSHHSEESVKKRAAMMRGRKVNRAAISKAKKGRPNGLAGRKGRDCGKSGLVFQIDEKTGEVVRIFFGFDEMARKTGFAKTPVREAANGVRCRAYGYLWRYQRRRTLDVFI